MSRIFISFGRTDSEGYVRRLYDQLIRHFERDDVFKAVIGPQWLSATDNTEQRRLDQWDDFVRLEIVTALKQNKLLIPVLVGQARMPAPAGVDVNCLTPVWTIPP